MASSFPNVGASPRSSLPEPAVHGYAFIAGVIEVASGVLVCFRRTTLLGACLMATALTNVVLVDLFYDVSVKLFASLYLALDVCLIARETPRLWAFFLQPSRDELSGTRARAARAIVVALVLGGSTAEILHDAIGYRVFHADALEGVWAVVGRSGLDDLLPETPGPWDKVCFEKGGSGSVRVGNRRVGFKADVEEAPHKLRLTKLGRQPSLTLEGTFELTGKEFHVAGNRGGTPFSLDLTREFPR